MESSRSRQSPDLYQRIAAEAATHLPRGAQVLIAFSGGLDSTVLLHALAATSERQDWRLHCAHVHHGLSPNADRWAAHCAAVAAGLRMPFSMHRVTVDRHSPDGLECAARKARYLALHAQAAVVAADAVLTAHHADDQAETMLHNMVRGAGLLGLAGMPVWQPATSGQPARCRPMLGLSRQALEACALENGLVWIEDESNADCRLARNYLRHTVMPALSGRWPRAAETLAGAARRLAEAQGLLDGLADTDAVALALQGEWGTSWSVEGLRALDPARRRNLLRRLLRQAGARSLPAEAWLDEWLRQLLAAQVDSECPVSHAGVAGFAHRARFWLLPGVDPLSPVPWLGATVVPWGAGRLQFKQAVGEGLSQAALAGASTQLRVRAPGDRIRRGPGRPRAGVKQIAQECGMPPWLRDRAPILVADGEPVWMPGCVPAEPWRAAPGEAGWLPVWTPCVPQSTAD